MSLTPINQQSFWIRKFNQYSNPEIFRKKYEKDPSHVNRRIAALFKVIPTLNVTPQAIRQFVTAIQGCDKLSRQHYMCMEAKDSNTAVLLIESEFSEVKAEEDLECAMSHNLVDVVRAILAKHVLSHNENFQLANRLKIWAIKNAHYDLALELIVKSGNAWDNSNGQTLANYAARAGIAAIIYVLINSNGAYDTPDILGKTPLMEACENGHLEIAKILLGKVTNPWLKDKKGFTALHYAAMKGHEDVVSLLLHYIIDDRSYLDDGSAIGQACIHKHSGCARLLLAAQPELTPLHDAVRSGLSDIVDLILQKKNDPDFINRRRYSNFSTALHEAGQGGHLEIAETLVKRGADVTLKRGDGSTILHWAAVHGWTSFIPVVLSRVPVDQQQSFVNQKDNSNRSGLAYAALNGHAYCIRALLHAGATLSMQDEEDLLFSLASRLDKDDNADLLFLLLRTMPEDKRQAMLRPRTAFPQTLLMSAFLSPDKEKKALPAIKLLEAGFILCHQELSHAVQCRFSDDENVEKLLSLIYSKIPDEKKQEELNEALGKLLFSHDLSVQDQETINRGEILEWQKRNLQFLIEKGAFLHDLQTRFLQLCSVKGFWKGNRLFFHYFRMLPPSQQQICLQAKSPSGRSPLSLVLCVYNSENDRYECYDKLAHELLDIGANDFDLDSFRSFIYHFSIKYELLAHRLILELFKQEKLHLWMDMDNRLGHAPRILKILLHFQNFDIGQKMFNTNIYQGYGDLRFLLNRPEFSDTKWEIQGEVFHVHLQKIAKSCKRGLTKRSPTLLRKEDLPYFRSMLELIYSGIHGIEIDHDRFKGLARMAIMFKCKDLVRRLQGWLSQHPECEKWKKLFESVDTQKRAKRQSYFKAEEPANKKR